MKIVYIHQYFETPDESGRTRSYWFAKAMVESGYDVSVITSEHSHSKRTAGVYDIDGINVVYLRNSYNNSMSNFDKIVSFLRFMILSSWTCLRIGNVRLVYASSTPLTVGIPALLCRVLKGIPFIFEVRDLWPEFPIQIGAIKNRYVIGLLKGLESMIYRKAKHIVALSPGMKFGVIKTGVGKDKVSLIPNMSKPLLFYPHPCSTGVRHKFSIKPENFNVIHFGTMGVANGLDYIIKAAHELSLLGQNAIQFYFAGRGAMEEVLKNEVKRLNLKNVHFLGYMNTYDIAEVVNCCDVTITTFKDIPILRTNSPNKLFDSLAAGKPVIVNSAGWTKDLVENSNCGVYVDVKEPKKCADALIYFKDNHKLVKEMGENARRLALEKYDKKQLVSQFMRLINENI